MYDLAGRKGSKKVSWGSDNYLDDQFLEAPRNGVGQNETGRRWGSHVLNLYFLHLTFETDLLVFQANGNTTISRLIALIIILIYTCVSRYSIVSTIH